MIVAAQTQDESSAGLGILIVGLGGAVASTMAAGIERIRCGAVDRTGLPLAAFDKAGLASYETLQIGGWDLNPDDLATALAGHRVLSRDDAAGISDALSRITPWPAVGNTAFCRNVDGRHRFTANSLLGAVEQLRINMRQFRERTGVQRLVVINLASVESWPADTQAFASLATFETALADNDPSVSPAMLYAYAAIAENVPYGNFTPSLGADIPALVEFAEQRGVPLAGKDGKTGQTFIKTVIAPALRDRNLHVDGWFSTNILGNRDGQALEDPGSLSSKLSTKGGVIDDIPDTRLRIISFTSTTIVPEATTRRRGTTSMSPAFWVNACN